MYCTSCGARLADDARFCEKCGAPGGESNMGEQKGKENAAVPDVSDKPIETVRINKDDNIRTETASFRKFFQNAMDAVNALDLNKGQKMAAVVAACSALFFLICVTGSLVSWITAVSGIILLASCLKKKSFDSMELTLAMTFFAARFLVVDIMAGTRVLSGGSSAHYGFFTVMMRLVTYGTAIIYWLAVLGRLRKRPSAYALILGLSCAELVYAAIRFLSAFSDGFRNTLFYLGWAGFFVCYIMFLGKDKETVGCVKSSLASLRERFSGSTYGVQPIMEGADVFTCVFCGNLMQSDDAFCDNCGAPTQKPEEGAVDETLSGATDEALNEVSDGIPNEATGMKPVPVVQEVKAETGGEKVCPQCGISLPGDSAFCEKCGTALET